jgi:hypothetical protein
MAGWEWMYSFLKRHPRLAIRKEELTHKQRALGMNKSKAGAYFKIWERKLTEVVFLNKLTNSAAPEPEGSSPHSQEPANDPYPDPGESTLPSNPSP